MSAWFSEVDLTQSPPPAQRLFVDLCQLLDQLDPANLDVEQQTAKAEPDGQAVIRLVHTSHRDADLDIEVDDCTTHIYGLHGHDEDHALPDGSEEVWRADTFDTIARLLRGRYRVQRWSWRGWACRTMVTDLTGDARNTVRLDSPLGLLPLPQRVLTVATTEIDYACRGAPDKNPSPER